MTQTVGQRGPQPPNYVSPSARPRAGNRKAGQQANPPANGVKFGGGVGQSLLNGSVGTFQKITEVFLWGFLAQDALAMWLPRVWTSLQEGKETYDPNEDPKAKDKPFDEQVRAWLTGNWKGLNWVNFFEGTKREFATGPGLLAVPAMAFMLNRAMANPAIELSASSINGLGEGLQTALAGNRYTKDQKSKFINDAKDYLKTVFADQEFAKKHEALISDWVENEVETSVVHADKKGFSRLASNTRQAFGFEKEAENLNSAREKLKEAIWDFNRDQRMNAYDHLKQGVIKDDAPLNNTGKTWVSYKPDALEAAKNKISGAANQGEAIAKAKKLVDQSNFAQVKNDINRIGGYLNKAWANFEKGGHGNIKEATEKTMKELTRNKWLFGGGVTLLTAAYLVKLAFWAQNHGTYQATRLLTDDASKKNKRSRGEQSDNTQPQAGLPFGSQPAFSRFTTNFPVRPQSSLSGNGFIQPSMNQPAFNQQVPNYPALFQGKKVEGGQA